MKKTQQLLAICAGLAPSSIQVLADRLAGHEEGYFGNGGYKRNGTRYMPHQGKQECERRVRQMKKAG